MAAPGVGKTRAARHYATQYANVWVAQMFPTCTLWSCLDRTARAVGLRTSHARSSRIEADLIERLNGSRGLLVIDEAHLLGARALEELRSLHDATGTGLALVGNPLLFSRLTGHRAEQFEQLYSRIGKIVRLPRTTVADADALLAAWGIAGPGVRDTAHAIVRTQGRPAETDQGLALGDAVRAWRGRYGRPPGRRLEGFGRPHRAAGNRVKHDNQENIITTGHGGTPDHGRDRAALPHLRRFTRQAGQDLRCQIREKRLKAVRARLTMLTPVRG